MGVVLSLLAAACAAAGRAPESEVHIIIPALVDKFSESKVSRERGKAGKAGGVFTLWLKKEGCSFVISIFIYFWLFQKGGRRCQELFDEVCSTCRTELCRVAHCCQGRNTQESKGEVPRPPPPSELPPVGFFPGGRRRMFSFGALLSGSA